MKKTVAPIPPISEDHVNQLADILRLMGDASRLKIIIACLEQPTCVSDIIEKVQLSQSLVSHHLRLLKATSLLNAKREGRQIFYGVNGDVVRCILVDLMRHVSAPAKGKDEC